MMSEEDNLQYLWNRRQALKVRALTNRLYQQDRWRLFEWREGAVKAASLIAGSVALARVADQHVVNACLAAIFAGTSASLVFGWGAKARDASRRAAEWATLERDMEAQGERTFTKEHLNTWHARAADAEANEPALHPALFERAYLRACEALGVQPSQPSAWWLKLRPALMVP
jgi:hypothetical protein